jgi:hypothetical protein
MRWRKVSAVAMSTIYHFRAARSAVSARVAAYNRPLISRSNLLINAHNKNLRRPLEGTP